MKKVIAFTFDNIESDWTTPVQWNPQNVVDSTTFPGPDYSWCSENAMPELDFAFEVALPLDFQS